MIWLLPDFIGHPGCFRALLPYLPAATRSINYHQLPLCDSVTGLAKHLVERFDEPPSTIIGYSFGGALGFELLQQLPSEPQLIMVDSHLPRAEFRQISPQHQFERWLTEETRDWIAMMAQLGEIRQEVVLHNIALFNRWIPEGQIGRALWIRCRGEKGDPAGDGWDRIKDLRHFDSDAAHHTVMLDRGVIAHISQLINEETVL